MEIPFSGEPLAVLQCDTLKFLEIEKYQVSEKSKIIQFAMIRATVKKFIPKSLWNRLGGVRRRWRTRDDYKLTRREVFARIYEEGLWGETGVPDFSGTGSRMDGVVKPYVASVQKWAQTHDSHLMTAVDLGCGDFMIGRQLRSCFAEYKAVDVVPSVINKHKSNPDIWDTQFCCLDAVEDELPQGDVLFVRQMLQHLSNEEILQIIPKFKRFQTVFVTEHIPVEGRLKIKNRDKSHGGGIRLASGSGVYLQDPPFCMSAKRSYILLEVNGGPKPVLDGVIRTTVYEFDSDKQTS